MEFREKPFQPTEVPQQESTEARKEKLADPEIDRLLNSLDRVNREFREREKISFADELDEIEIRDALDALYELRKKYSSGFHDFGSVSLAEEERQAVLDYHARLQEIDKIATTPILPQELGRENWLQGFERISKVRELLRSLEVNWDMSVCTFLVRRERKEGRYINPVEEFGGFGFPTLDTIFASTPESREQLFKYPELSEAYKRFHIDQYPNLQLRLQEAEQSLNEWTQKHPEEVRNFLTQLHASDDKIDSSIIDDIIGIKPEKTERSLDIRRLENQYGHEQYTYQGTPYELIREFIKKLNLSESDVLYDLGCGYGRIPLYGAMTTKAQYRGIEIVPERVAEANAVKSKFKLDNVEFRQGNVLEQNYTDGSVFFLFNPFTRETLERVGKQLEELAKTKKIRVVSLGPSTGYFRSQDWLKPVETESKEHPWSLTIFESV